MNTDLEEAGNNGFDAIVDFLDSGVIGSAVNLGDLNLFRLGKAGKDILGLGEDFSASAET